jgi:hypothetical protein
MIKNDNPASLFELDVNGFSHTIVVTSESDKQDERDIMCEIEVFR